MRTEPKLSARRGIVIFIIFSLIGIVGGIAAIYLFTSGQSRLQSRRIFWGEAVLYVAESLLDETFYEIKKRSAIPSDNSVGGGGWFRTQLTEGRNDAAMFDRPLEEFAVFQSLEDETLFLPGGLSLDPDKIQIRVLPYVLKMGPGDGLFEGEIYGFVEVEVEVHVNMGSGLGGSGLVRRIQGRRDFRLTSVLGQEPLLDYALLLKRSPEPSSVSELGGQNRLTIRQSPALSGDEQEFFGKAYFGKGEEGRSTVVLQGIQPTQTEGFFLEQSGIYGLPDAEKGFVLNLTDPALLSDSAKNPQAEYVASVVLSDPVIQAVLRTNDLPSSVDGLEDDEKYAVYDAVLGFLQEEIRRGGELEINTSLSPVSYPSLNMAYDGGQSSRSAVEGSAVRLFGFEGEVFYRGFPTLGSAGNEGRAFLSQSVRPMNEVIRREEGILAPMSGVEGLTGNDDAIDKQVPWKEPVLYSYVYYNHSGMTGWEHFRRDHTLKTGSGKTHMKVDGIMAINGAVHFEGDYLVEGCGVLLVKGPITITGEIAKSGGAGSADCLILSTRSQSVDEQPAGGFLIQTEQEIQAMLQALSYNVTEKTASLRTSGGDFHILGGVQANTLNQRDLSPGSTITYDPVFSRSYRSLTFAVPVHLYKIHNKSRTLEL